MINIITLATLSLSNLLGLLLGIIVFLFILLLAIYIYTSLALMKIAKRTSIEPAWLAWIPYANIYLISKIAQKHWWPITLIIISTIMSFIFENTFITIINYLFLIVFLIFNMIWWWKICERRGKPGWWTLIVLIPIIGWIWGLVMIGILAWGKDNNTSSVKIPKPKTY